MITAENISFVSNGQTLLTDVNLTIEEGTRTAVIGPNGCGKSLLLKILAGIVVPNSGQIRYFGKDFQDLDKKDYLALRRRIGFMFQDGALWENKNVGQNLDLPLSFHFPDLPARERNRIIDSLLAEAGLSHEKTNRPAILSQGEFKMVSFLRAIILDPDILFLDQPENALDTFGLEYVNRKLRQFAQRNATLIYISTHGKWITELSTHLLVMDHTRVLAHAPTRELIRSTDGAIRRILATVPDIDLVLADDILNLLEEST